MAEPVKAPRRLYYDADRKLVEEGDPKAATLAYPEGDEMSAEDAKALGSSEVKQVKEPPENKQVRAAPETKTVK